MSGCRFLVSVLAVSIGVLAVEPFANLDIAFAQSVEEAARLNEQAAQLYQQGRYADAEPLAKNEPASPEREKARREAARAIVTQGTLLCVSARLVEPQAVMIAATDGMQFPAQLFMPPNLRPGEKRPAAPRSCSARTASSSRFQSFP